MTRARWNGRAISVATVDGTEIVAAFEFGDSGLAVHRSLRNSYGWRVTQCSTGFSVTGPLRSRAVARALAEKLARLGDWHQGKFGKPPSRKSSRWRALAAAAFQVLEAEVWQ